MTRPNVIGTWRYRVKRIDASTMVRQFKHTFDEESLNELGKATRLCQREREATPYRLMVTLMEAFSCGKLDSIADIHRTFNALCEREVQYKPFHNQLAKRGFPQFVRLMLTRLLNDLACTVLRFAPDSPFAGFEHILMQDGTSFAVKPTLADTFPGRFTTISPAAVELHVNLDLASEVVEHVTLSADSAGEREFLPAVEDMRACLVLADRGYFSKKYFRALEQSGGCFIVRGKTDINPLIHKAIGPHGHEVKWFRNKRLKAVKSRLSRYQHLDMTVRFDSGGEVFECRLVVHPHIRRDATPRFLLTNLAPETFSPEHISDGYRLRWQVELLFKEWKSHANLRAFDTANANIAEGLIWASLCAATVKRYCAHMTQHIARVAMSTHTVAKCLHHVLSAILYDLMHEPRKLPASVERAVRYLAHNAKRAKPDRDKRTGRGKLGLVHVYAGA